MAPQIIFLHLQKTGGTSVQQAMKAVLKDVRAHRAPRDGIWKPPLVDFVTGVDAIVGHMPFGIHRLLPEPVPYYFTVIREPAARHISRYRSHHSIYDAHTLIGSHLDKWGMVYQLGGIPRAKMKEGLDKGDVDQALKNVEEHFLHVGRTSRLDETGQWLHEQLGTEVPLPWVNKADAHVKVTEEQWAEVRALPELKWDYMLYNELVARGPNPAEW